MTGPEDKGKEKQRKQNRCSLVPQFLCRIQSMLLEETGFSMSSYPVTQDDTTYDRTISSILETLRTLQESKGQYDGRDIDVTREPSEMSLADMETVCRCLHCSRRGSFLLIHYDEPSLWGCRHIPEGMDRWMIYHGLMQECRSCIVSLETLDYISLPYAKFRNLGEAPAYSLEAVAERMIRSETVEFSEKLDGSMIQMRYLGLNTLQDGLLVATSGSLNRARSPQLDEALTYLASSGQAFTRIAMAYPDSTFICEWISEKDRHIVTYGSEEFGLHLIGKRDVNTGQLSSYRDVLALAEQFHVPTTTLYAMDLKNCLDSLSRYQATEKEGYVLNLDGFLVKIKCRDFIERMRMIQRAGSFPVILDHMVSETLDDYLSTLPEGMQKIVMNKAQEILAYQEGMTQMIDLAAEIVPQKMNRAETMAWISEKITAAHHLRAFVITQILGHQPELLVQKRGKSVKYVKESEVKGFLQDRETMMHELEVLKS